MLENSQPLETNQHNDTKADFWTNAQAAVELLTCFDTLVWIAAMIEDGVSPPNPSIIPGLSWWSLGFGGGATLLLALAELQCHKIQNIVNQKKDFPISLAAEKPVLTMPQKLYLAGETISHIGETAWKFTLASRLFNNPWARLGLHISGVAFGILGSGGVTRTHYHSILKYNSMFKNSKKPVEVNDDYQKMEEEKVPQKFAQP
jgi:hypothetical protein